MVAQPDLINIPANTANYMLGRQGTPVKHITFHHVVGPASSAIARFKTPVQVSAHFIVGASAIYCMVDTDNTAYTNGNWNSNLESVTIEHEGTWLNGFRDENVINNSVRLVAWLRTIYPSATPTRHRDVIDKTQYPGGTACPGDLPVEEIWQKASTLLNPPPPTQPEWLRNRSPVATTKYAIKPSVQLWNLNDPSTPADARVFPLNQKFDIGSITSVGGKDYYITKYSTDKNIPAGYRAEDLSDTPYSQPQLPPPVTPVPAPIPEIPTGTNVQYPNWFIDFFVKLIDAIKGILKIGK